VLLGMIAAPVRLPSYVRAGPSFVRINRRRPYNDLCGARRKRRRSHFTGLGAEAVTRGNLLCRNSNIANVLQPLA
jgi:hypothetical protein